MCHSLTLHYFMINANPVLTFHLGLSACFMFHTELSKSKSWSSIQSSNSQYHKFTFPVGLSCSERKKGIKKNHSSLTLTAFNVSLLKCYSFLCCIGHNHHINEGKLRLCGRRRKVLSVVACCSSVTLKTAVASSRLAHLEGCLT